MDKLKYGFPNTEAEREYLETANNYKTDLRKIFESAQDYVPGTPSDKLSEISTLLGRRKKESADAFDKLTGEVLSEIDEKDLIQRKKPLEQKGGGFMYKK